MKAELFYYISVDPRKSKNHDKLWRDVMNNLEGEGAVNIKRSFYVSNWRLMSKDNVEMINNKPVLGKMFEKYNTYNPLATKEGQAKIRASKVRHTSMSVGDIIKVGDNRYIVAPIGFRKVRLV